MTRVPDQSPPFLLLALLALGSGCAGDPPAASADACASYKADAGVYAVCVTRSAGAEPDLSTAGARCDLLPAPASLTCRSRWVGLNASNTAFAATDLTAFCSGAPGCNDLVASARPPTDPTVGTP